MPYLQCHDEWICCIFIFNFKYTFALAAIHSNYCVLVGNALPSIDVHSPKYTRCQGSAKYLYLIFCSAAFSERSNKWANKISASKYPFVYGVIGTINTHFDFTLQWCCNGRDSVSNHQPHHCLLKRLFRLRAKKTSKLRVTGLCAGNSPGPVTSPHK